MANLVVHNWILQIKDFSIPCWKETQWRATMAATRNTHKHLLPLGYVSCMFINIVMSPRSSDDVQI